MSESTQETSISRAALLKRGAATVAGATVLTSTAGSAVATAAISREAPFNIVGRAQVTLTVALNSTSNNSGLQLILRRFEAHNPQIKVKQLAIVGGTWTAFFEALLTRIAGGNAPDIAQIPIEGMALLGSKNLALPLDDFMKQDAAYIEELRSDTLPIMFKVLSYKGKQLGLPFDWNNMMVWYNTRLFAQTGLRRPPNNWTGDDFLAMCAKLKQQGKYGTIVPTGTLFALEPWSLASGADLLSPDWASSTATARGNQVAWQFLYDLVWKYKYSPKPDPNFPQQTFFESGRLGTFMAGRWPLQGLLQDKFTAADIQYFPVLGGGPRRVISGIGGFPIFKATKYPEQAWALSKFTSTTEAQRAWTYNGFNIPTRRSLALASYMNPPAHYRDFYESAEAGTVPTTAPPQYNEIDTAATKWYSKMMTNQVSPNAALAGLDKDITAILSKSV